MTELEMRGAIQALEQGRAERRLEQAQSNLNASERFLENSRRRENVVVLPGGLQYQILRGGRT